VDFISVSSCPFFQDLVPLLIDGALLRGQFLLPLFSSADALPVTLFVAAH
jgi:hypothetical protein